MNGIAWRVGNGKTIPFSDVHWIPRVLQQFAQPIIPLPEDLKVDFLIDE
jgi:hypothetical protein